MGPTTSTGTSSGSVWKTTTSGRVLSGRYGGREP